MKTPLSQLAVVLAVAAIVLWPQSGSCAENSLFLSAGARRVTIGIPSHNEQSPSLIIHIEQMRREYEIRGFFRIGLLPIEIAQGVVFEINQPESISNCLARCEECLFAQSTRRLELRDFQLIIHGTTATRLACSIAKPLEGGRLELVGPVTLESGTNRLEVACAMLEMKGARAGELTINKPPWKTNLTQILANKVQRSSF